MKMILILSGGLDSTVALYYLRAQGAVVKALSVDYGQRHRKELVVARTLCNELRVEHRIANLSSITDLLGSSSQTDRSIDVPHGHYAEESMKKTIVPNRNMLMLSVAYAWAMASEFDAVAYGAHAGDHAIYPDCRPEFAEKLSEAALLADYRQVQLVRPFITMTKADIVKLGAELQVPMHRTWSCYEGKLLHCGKCGTCVERIEAFELAGVKDKTEYAHV